MKLCLSKYFELKKIDFFQNLGKIYGFYFFRFEDSSSSIALRRSKASIPVDGGGFGALEVFAK